MPKQSLLDRGQKIREYFLAKYGNGNFTVEDAKADLCSRFGIKGKSGWQYWKRELEHLASAGETATPPGREIASHANEEEAGSQEVIHLPSDLSPEAKMAFNRLLLAHDGLAHKLEQQQSLVAKVMDESVRCRKRLDLLKRLSKEVIDCL